MNPSDQQARAEAFRSMHRPGNPLILVNVWDVGSARAVAAAGAPAIATASWAVAAAHGFDDGEQLPLDLALANLERIAKKLPLPVSIDLERGYASEPGGVFETAGKALERGAVGFNLEDGIAAGSLRTLPDQLERLRAAKAAAEASGISAFINARCDLFLSSPPEEHGDRLAQALERADAYARAGAHGFFAPGLWQEALITDLARASPLPLNVMVMDDSLPADRLAELGVARISYGPRPYHLTMQRLEEIARAARPAPSH